MYLPSFKFVGIVIVVSYRSTSDTSIVKKQNNCRSSSWNTSVIKRHFREKNNISIKSSVKSSLDTILELHAGIYFHLIDIHIQVLYYTDEYNLRIDFHLVFGRYHSKQLSSHFVRSFCCFCVDLLVQLLTVQILPHGCLMSNRSKIKFSVTWYNITACRPFLQGQ